MSKDSSIDPAQKAEWALRDKVERALLKVSSFEEILNILDGFASLYGKETISPRICATALERLEVTDFMFLKSCLQTLHTRYGVTPGDRLILPVIHKAAFSGADASRIVRELSTEWSSPVTIPLIMAMLQKSHRNEIVTILTEFLPINADISPEMLKECLQRCESAALGEELISSLRKKFSIELSSTILQTLIHLSSDQKEAKEVLLHHKDLVQEENILTQLLLYGSAKNISVNVEILHWFRDTFPSVALSSISLNQALQNSLVYDTDPMQYIKELEEAAGVSHDQRTLMIALEKCLTRIALTKEKLGDADKVLALLEPLNITIDIFAKLSVMYRLLAGKYYLLKQDSKKALEIFVPLLQKKKLRPLIKMYAVGMLGTYLPTNHPVLKLIATADELEKHILEYKAKADSLDMYFAQNKFGGGNVWDGLHTVPVNRGAVDEFRKEKK